MIELFHLTSQLNNYLVKCKPLPITIYFLTGMAVAACALSFGLHAILESSMETMRKLFELPILGLLILSLAACGGGGGGGPPKVQPVADAQQANVLINISAGFGPAAWVLLQYDDQSQLYNVFINRAQLPTPSSGGKPDIGAITADPNNWESYARSSVTVLGTTTSLALDSGTTPNTYTTTPQALSDFVTGNANLAQTAWNEISEK